VLSNYAHIFDAELFLVGSLQLLLPFAKYTDITSIDENSN
jgi:hypothetical protein